MRNTMTIKDGEALVRILNTMSEDELRLNFIEAAQDFYMETLEEKDRDLNLTGKCKKCYDYLAEQFTSNYMEGKSLFTFLEDVGRDKFYNTWLVFLEIARCIVRDGGDGGEFSGIGNIINNSGISRKTWLKFFDSLPRR